MLNFPISYFLKFTNSQTLPEKTSRLNLLAQFSSAQETSIIGDLVWKKFP